MMFVKLFIDRLLDLDALIVRDDRRHPYQPAALSAVRKGLHRRCDQPRSRRLHVDGMVLFAQIDESGTPAASVRIVRIVDS